MGGILDFLHIKRNLPTARPPKERVGDYQEIYLPTEKAHVKEQSARCMNCGIPFCHNACPLGNIIPEFNDAVYNGDWQRAYHILVSTNNFPEFTGRICPAPCEASCVLGINSDAVTIEFIEKSIIEYAFEAGYVKPKLPIQKREKKIAVIGSGPAGLAAADQLHSLGYQVTVFEKNDKPGGLLRYGIPDFKLEKWVVDRRLALMEEVGISFRCNTNIGKDIAIDDILKEFDGTLLCCGSNVPRDIAIPGREAKGIYFAMDYLENANRAVSAHFTSSSPIDVFNKKVVVIGGGDTGSDCVGTAHRQGASSVTQLEIAPMPSSKRLPDNPWPQWPLILRTSSSHEEGGQRQWSVLTKSFEKNERGEVIGLWVAQVHWDKKEDGRYGFIEMEGTAQLIEADVVFIAAGFLHTDPNGIVSQLSLEKDQHGNVKTTNYMTSQKAVFAAGDMRRGQSLVVWAIQEGRSAAQAIHHYFTVEE